jgi:DUF3040 family protein
MALDAGDQARLRRIEAELSASDPALARRFRRWRPTGRPMLVRPGWTVVPDWMLVVFVCGFATWVLGPALGGAVLVVGGCWVLLWRIQPPKARPGGDDGRGGQQIALGS